MSGFGNYLFKMYRPGLAVFRYAKFFACNEMEAWDKAEEWAYCNGYVDFELVSDER